MKKLLLMLLAVYQKTISPFTQSFLGGSCRFQPTCSEYAKEAIMKYGSVHGTILSFKRILKCHPWGNSGFDPVPPTKL